MYFSAFSLRKQALFLLLPNQKTGMISDLPLLRRIAKFFYTSQSYETPIDVVQGGIFAIYRKGSEIFSRISRNFHTQLVSRELKFFYTGSSKLVFAVLKKLLAAKSMQKTDSKSAIGKKSLAQEVRQKSDISEHRSKG